MKTRHFDLTTNANGVASQLVGLRQKGYTADDIFGFFNPKGLIINIGNEPMYVYILGPGEEKTNSNGVLLQANTEYTFNLDSIVFQVDIEAVNDVDSTGYTQTTVQLSCYSYIHTGDDEYNGIHNQEDI